MIKDATLNQTFLHDGYIILRGIVPANRLEPLRNAYEIIIGRAREADAEWDTTATARTHVDPYLDQDTLETLEFALHENTFAVSTQVLGCNAEELALTQVSVLCNPEFEPTDADPSGQSWGTDPRNWHRDVRPDHDAPLSALLSDEGANGPGHAQWNIALYDDSILYLVPGSHRRLTSEVESAQLQSDGGTQIPLSESICADLKPGDGVVYNSMLLHWGSKYTKRHKRRTIHLGYRTFGRIFPHQRECRLPERVSELLPAGSPQRRTLEHGFDLFRHEYTLLHEIFGAVIADDVTRFEAGLARLHPNSEGRITCLIVLAKLVRNICRLSRDEEGTYSGKSSEGVEVQEHIASKFTTTELDKLWERFGALDDMLRSGKRTHVSGFLGPTTDYHFEELPSWMTTDHVIGAMFGQPDPAQSC